MNPENHMQEVRERVIDIQDRLSVQKMTDHMTS